MKPQSEPWLTTYEHLPYLVLFGNLPSALSFEETVNLFSRSFPRVFDVQNSTAFSLNDECTAIFSIKRDRQCALLIFVDGPIDCSSCDHLLDGLSAMVTALVQKINKTWLVDDGENGFRATSWNLEVSRQSR